MFQLQLILLLSCGIVFRSFMTLFIYSIMPVTTRSQARALRDPSLYTGPSNATINNTNLSSSIVSNVESLDIYAMDLSQQSVIKYPMELSKHTSSSSSLTPSSSISKVLDFQTKSESTFFEISNFSTFENALSISNTATFSNNNFSLATFKMESDEEEESAPVVADTHASVPIEQLFANFTNQLASQINHQTNILRSETRDNELQVNQEHENFKLQVQLELQELGQLLQSQHAVSSPTPPVVNNSPTLSVVSPVSSSSSTSPALMSEVSPTVPTLGKNQSVSTTNDVHSQMMLMMAKLFSKLSTVLAETKHESKAEWPKFSGETKKFRDWYLSIMTQVSLPPWNSLYDATTNDIVSTTMNTVLNGKFYSKIILALEGKALKHAVSRKHVRANGLLLLQELTKAYKPTNVPEVIAAKNC
jgi:hypothetical protein